MSIGIAVSGNGDRSVDELLRQADLAMYAAKRDGKHRWDLYDRELERLAPTPARRGARALDLVPARRRAARGDRRPPASATARSAWPSSRSSICAPASVAGYEALARFAGPETRPPNAWFAQAHRCGLGYELEARAVAAALAAPGRPAGTYLTVNLSPSALTSAAVQAVLPESLDGIVIELTENELLADAPGLEPALADVRERGGRVAIDDAGAGYAGLKHVMRLGPDLIKLDRSLVAGVEHDDGRASLISSFVRYGRESGAAVCAEGIETLGDLTRLADLDVSFGQGYVIGRPNEGWPSAARNAVDACAVSFTAALANPQDGGASALESILALIARARTGRQLAHAAGPIASELRADCVQIHRIDAQTGVRTDLLPTAAAAELLHPAALGRLVAHEVVQVLAADPGACPREQERLARAAHRSLLRVPVTCQGTLVGSLEAYRTTERPWSRLEIGSARIISHQLGAALELVDPAPWPGEGDGHEPLATERHDGPGADFRPATRAG